MLVADADMTNKIGLQISAMTSEGLGIDKLNVADGSVWLQHMLSIQLKMLLKKVSEQRSVLGAVQEQIRDILSRTWITLLRIQHLLRARSSDTDMATEMVKYSNSNILAQAGQSMLAQANQSNQGVLSLLG